MGDYQPVFTGGAKPRTLVCSADVIGGRVVAESGNGTVAHAAADSTVASGVTAHDALSGTPVLVWPLEGPTHELEATGAIAAGAGVVTDAAGQVKSATLATAAAAGTLIGHALTTAAGSPTLKLRVYGRR